MIGIQPIAFTWPSGSQTASGINVSQYGQLAGLYIDDGVSGSYVQLQVSMDGVTWTKLATGGAWYSAQISANAWNVFALEPHLSYPFVRPEITATAQTGEVNASAFIRPI